MAVFFVVVHFAKILAAVASFCEHIATGSELYALLHPNPKVSALYVCGVNVNV